MAIYHKIPRAYLTNIPAIYFAGMGVFDIVSDSMNHKLIAGNIIFNLFLFSPLILRHRIVYMVFGVLAGAFSIYALMALLYFFHKYMGGSPIRYPVDTFIIGPVLATLTLLLSLSLIYGGSIMTVRHSRAG